MKPLSVRMFLSVALLSLTELAFGDVFILKDGTCLKGNMRMRTQGNIFVVLEDGKNRNIPKDALERIIEGTDARCPDIPPDSPAQEDRATEEQWTEEQPGKGPEPHVAPGAPVGGTEPPEPAPNTAGVITKDPRLTKFIAGLRQRHASAKKAIQKAIEQAKTRHKAELERADVTEATLRLECVEATVAKLRDTGGESWKITYVLTSKDGKDSRGITCEVTRQTADKAVAEARKALWIAQGRDRQQKELERLEAVLKSSKKTQALIDKATQAAREVAQQRPESLDSEMRKWEQAVEDSVQELLKALEEAENLIAGPPAP